MQARKLIAHGPSSLTIALPHKWVKKNNLQKGDSVILQEDDLGLRINHKPSEMKKSISVNLSGHDGPATLTVLTTIYRRGYDEVTARYDSNEEYHHISSAMRSLLGFAIIENGKGRCVMKGLPSNLEQDFNSLFRRVFLILLSQLDELSVMLSSQESLKEFYHRDADMNAIVNLAIRMINKGYVQDRFDELHLFHSLLQLEECGDDLVRFSIECLSEKDPSKSRVAIEHCSKMLRLLYDGYFQKKITIMEFYRLYYLYWPNAKKKPVPVYDFFAKESRSKPVFYLRSFVEKVIQLAELLLLPQVQKD